MRILGTVVQKSTRSVPDIGQDFTMRHTATMQAVGDETPWLVFQPVQQTLEEALGRSSIPAFLHENVSRA